MADTKSRDERYTHRLEAFSDIVIGFSLAQMSVNLAIPSDPSFVYTKSATLFAFAWTFSVIVAFWWGHHRLFDAYFVPRRATVVLNFLTLAVLVWLVYQLQIFVHFADNPKYHPAAALSYVCTYALLYLLLDVLYVFCVRLRWGDLNPADRRQGINSIGRILAIGAGPLAGLAVCYAFGLAFEWSLFGIFAAQMVWRLVSPVVVGRVAGEAA
jgi:uncharacterized membrane protein